MTPRGTKEKQAQVTPHEIPDQATPEAYASRFVFKWGVNKLSPWAIHLGFFLGGGSAWGGYLFYH